MTKRKTYRLRKGELLEVEEYHDGNYGAPGQRRRKKEKPTEEQMQRVNSLNKARLCRRRMLEYINPGDIFATWTYEVDKRPDSMAKAKQDFNKAMRYVRRQYKAKGKTLHWFKNIEQGTKGAWHIHIVINEIGETASILEKAWEHGGTYAVQIRKCKLYDADFTKIAAYITKDENTRQKNKDGTTAKPRLKQSAYSTSRNMPVPEPKKEKLIRWAKEPKAKKGYQIISIHEGINPITGYKYRRYMMARTDTLARDG